VSVRLEPVSDRESLVPILLEADAEPVLRTYLHDGDLYKIVADGDEVGAVLLIRDGDAVEVKAIALAEPFRGRGLGSATIDEVKSIARASGAARLQVGTADSSVDAIAFYRRVGFGDSGRLEGFFDAYPEPVIEDGVVAHDMVRFEMLL
jgi:ribosomal protein S18 acetylase RimI-like enzyme